MGEITTVNAAGGKTPSLRVVIPQGVVRDLKLRKGSQLEWRYVLGLDGKMVLSVEKVK